jgi:hypothetical protein
MPATFFISEYFRRRDRKYLPGKNKGIASDDKKLRSSASLDFHFILAVNSYLFPSLFVQHPAALKCLI